jgi:hypothetical protein
MMSRSFGYEFCSKDPAPIREHKLHNIMTEATSAARKLADCFECILNNKQKEPMITESASSLASALLLLLILLPIPSIGICICYHPIAADTDTSCRTYNPYRIISILTEPASTFRNQQRS